ncbi:MAG: ATP-binding protein [Candidatus Eisenbacteria bacterium]|nr:ATP-binding protein [Candidatus Eisenbacteria bacterium]
MGAAPFLARAAEEAQRYGDDPWVFLRELVQNSRDAHAGRIDLSVADDAAGESVACEDDGHGMSEEVARRYLLRLYASSKGEDGSIGYFGVGFWSILRFAPRSVTVTSRSAEGAVGLEIDCRAGTLTAVPVTIPHRGTRVELTRDGGAGPAAVDGLHAAVRDRLRHYAAHIRPTCRWFESTLPVSL